MNKENIKKNFIEKIKNNKKLQYVLVGVLVILILVVFFFSGNVKKKETETDVVLNYINGLESKLKTVLSKVEGAGDVDVIIAVDSGMETVLAKKSVIREGSGETEIEETPIIVNGKTVPIKEVYPKITGVLIICEGAKNIAVYNKIQRATISLLDIEVNQIEILTKK